MAKKRLALGIATFLLGLAPLAIAASSPNELRLSATIENGDLVAVLSNVSDRPIKTLGTHVSPFPGSGGFYIRLHDANGNRVKYCAMIDEENPAEHLLRPHGTIVYRSTIESLTDEYCLGAGKYTAQVVYFNSLPAGGPSYSAPVISSALEIVVQKHRNK